MNREVSVMERAMYLNDEIHRLCDEFKNVDELVETVKGFLIVDVKGKFEIDIKSRGKIGELIITCEDLKDKIQIGYYIEDNGNVIMDYIG